jgi:hypothetical protein
MLSMNASSRKVPLSTAVPAIIVLSLAGWIVLILAGKAIYHLICG